MKWNFFSSLTVESVSVGSYTLKALDYEPSYVVKSWHDMKNPKGAVISLTFEIQKTTDKRLRMLGCTSLSTSVYNQIKESSICFCPPLSSL